MTKSWCHLKVVYHNQKKARVKPLFLICCSSHKSLSSLTSVQLPTKWSFKSFRLKSNKGKGQDEFPIYSYECSRKMCWSSSVSKLVQQNQGITEVSSIIKLSVNYLLQKKTNGHASLWEDESLRESWSEKEIILNFEK